MIKDLYKKENNLFQGEAWLKFREDYGNQVIPFENFSGILLDTPLRQKFIWVQKGPAVLTDENLKEIKKKGTEVGASFVRVEPGEISTEKKLTPVTKKSLLSGQASPKATSVLNITRSEEEILSVMKPKTRYNIRLAEKKGVTVKIINDPDMLYNLLVSTSEKGTGFFPHEKEYYQKMMSGLGTMDLVTIFVAEHEGEPLSAILVTFYGKVATYLHGGQSDNKKNLMAPYLCQWAAIMEAKSRNCEIYDFWGVAESDDPNDSWSGITRFKEGFGGKKVVFPGTYDIIINPYKYQALSLAAKGKHIIKK